jgi:predicted ester cyclase
MKNVLVALTLALSSSLAACGASDDDTLPAGDDLTQQAGLELWDEWANLWNGDLASADELVAPEFVTHFAALDPRQPPVQGPEGLKAWIEASVGDAFTDYSFTTDVGPIIDGDMLAGRWTFEGTYRGGFPGIPESSIGKKVRYSGHDLLRVESGKIVEYWLTSDVMALLQQLGAGGM